MEDAILDMLILGDYTFEEVAKYFDIPISEVKRIYKKSQY